LRRLGVPPPPPASAVADPEGTSPHETIAQRLHRTGIVRLGSPRRGFRYRRANGGQPSRADRARIEALVIPPAWRDVRIATSPRDRVQAIGRDQRGRIQYRYHEAQAARRERDKLERILRFAEALPRLRARVERDLRRRGLGRERVLAAVVGVLGACLLRPGSASYAKENGSFGVATLRPRHVRTHGASIVFEFPGKAGKHHRYEMRDARVAAVVRELLRVRNEEVFAFEAPTSSPSSSQPRERGDRGRRRFVDVRRRDVNAYLAEITGEAVSAKDFRTWGGTLVCASALAKAGCPANGSAAAGRLSVAAALRETAAVLGNTPAVCRKSYVFATILRAYDRGRTVAGAVPAFASLVSNADPRLRRFETAVLKLLRTAAAAR
jgi:DNA topoisomerase-1